MLDCDSNGSEFSQDVAIGSFPCYSAQGEVRGIVFAQCAVRKPFRPAGHTAAVQVCRAQGPQFQWVNHRTPEGCGLAGTLKII